MKTGFAPIDGATVNIVDGATTKPVAQSDNSGQYEADVPDGNVKILVTRNGYYDRSQDAVVPVVDGVRTLLIPQQQDLGGWQDTAMAIASLEGDAGVEAYKTFWGVAENNPIPTSARVAAAKVFVQKGGGRYPDMAKIKDFADADPAAVADFEKKMGDSITGVHPIPDSAEFAKTGLKPEQLTDVVACQIVTKPVDAGQRGKFIQQYQEVWGEKAAATLQTKIAHPDRTNIWRTNPGRFRETGEAPG
jgi:hypothetical protein